MAEFPAPAEGIVLTHFIVASDVDRILQDAAVAGGVGHRAVSTVAALPA